MQKFSELQYTRPDMEAFRETFEQAIRELEQAEQKPIVFADDCPEMTVAQLLEFKPFHQKKAPKQTVSLRLSPTTLDLAKRYGSGYTTFLSRLLDEAIKDEALVKRCL